MRTTDRVFGYAILTVLPGKTLEKCAVFLFFRERVWEKRRRRFALPVQSKKGLVECGGKRSATPFFFREQYLGITFSVSWRVYRYESHLIAAPVRRFERLR
jgi:hypothetical protein